MLQYKYHIKALFRPVRKESFMAEKRKDSKNRNLLTGESERKDGTYMYRYTDTYGKRRTVYAPNLNELRKKERQIRKDIEDGIFAKDGEITVKELLDIYVNSNTRWKVSTKDSHIRRVNKIKSYPIGNMKINQVRTSTVQSFYLQLAEEGLSTNMIQGLNAVLSPAFDKAVEDDWIRKNPCSHKKDYLPKSMIKRKPLTKEEEENLLLYSNSIKKYQIYHDIFVILLDTGMRISEFIGLTLNDIDLKNRTVNICHQLLYRNNNSSNAYIETLKTSNGERKLYITDRAYKAFGRLILKRPNDSTLSIDGYSDFLLAHTNRCGIINYQMIKYNLHQIIAEYNAVHDSKIPDISPHYFRHTFCSRIVERGVDIMYLQYLMGHGDVSTSLNIYTHTTESAAINAMKIAVGE